MQPHVENAFLVYLEEHIPLQKYQGKGSSL